MSEQKKDPYENPKDAFGTKKAPIRLIPPSALVHEALALRNGAEKYSAYNWREKRVRMSIYIDAALRHILAFHDGEDYDPESGAHNLGHARACLGIILDALEMENIADDRPIAAPIRRLLNQVRDGQVGIPETQKYQPTDAPDTVTRKQNLNDRRVGLAERRVYDPLFFCPKALDRRWATADRRQC